MIKKKSFKNQLKQHSIKHTRSNTQEHKKKFSWIGFYELHSLKSLRQRLQLFIGTKKLVRDLPFQLKARIQKYKLRISSQKINQMKQKKYLVIDLRNTPFIESSSNQLKTKLSKVCGLLTKLCYYVYTTTLRSIYFAICDPHLSYESQIQDQKRTETLR